MKTEDLSLFHLIKQPKSNTGKAAALFLFHGYGSDENDLFSFADELPSNLFIISARAPYAMQPYGNAWYAIHWDNSGKFSDDKQAIESRELIRKFILEATEAYDLDPENINLLGFSQGSILSYAVAISYPKLIKNVVALSGYVNQDILKEDYTSNDFSEIEFYCSHGSVDQVIPVDWARKTQPFLEKLSIKNQYSEFPVGHGVAPQNFFEFKSWLEKRI